MRVSIVNGVSPGSASTVCGGSVAGSAAGVVPPARTASAADGLAGSDGATTWLAAATARSSRLDTTVSSGCGSPTNIAGMPMAPASSCGSGDIARSRRVRPATRTAPSISPTKRGRRRRRLIAASPPVSSPRYAPSRPESGRLPETLSTPEPRRRSGRDRSAGFGKVRKRR